jgi:hypothetical protein
VRRKDDLAALPMHAHDESRTGRQLPPAFEVRSALQRCICQVAIECGAKIA